MTSQSLLPYFEISWSAIPLDLLLGLVFIPAFLVFVKPYASIRRILLSAGMVLILAGGAVLFIGMLDLEILEVDVHHLVGFYISAALVILSPAYALWLSCRSVSLLCRGRRQEKAIHDMGL